MIRFNNIFKKWLQILDCICFDEVFTEEFKFEDYEHMLELNL